MLQRSAAVRAVSSTAPCRQRCRPPAKLGRSWDKASSVFGRFRSRCQVARLERAQGESADRLQQRSGHAAPTQLRAEEGPAPVAPDAGSTSRTSGYLALLGVALLWGSYTPAIRLLYEIPTPPDPPLLNALQACLSAAFLVAANVTASITHTPNNNPRPFASNPLMAEDIAVRQATIQRDRAGRRQRRQLEGTLQDWQHEAGEEEEQPHQQQQASAMSALGQAALPAEPPRRPPSNGFEHALASALNWRTTDLTWAGAEVGLWMCLAFGLEVAGLQLTSATKVAFLNQVSVLITPLLVHLSGERVRGLEWVACGLGLLGSILVALDSLMSGGGGGGAHGAHGAAEAAAGQGNEVLGLIFVLVSAVFFALSTVRLGRYSSMFDPLKLSTASTCTLGLLSLGWVTASILGRADGAAYEMEVINNMLASSTCVLTLIWVGLGPGALAAYLQATGQKSVPPAQAQVIYSTTPLWAAGFALLALDASDEAMGSIAWVGAAVMLGSSLMTALLPSEGGPGPLAPAGSADADGLMLPMSTFEESTDNESDGEGDGGGQRRAGWQQESERRWRQYQEERRGARASPAPLSEIEEEVRARQGLRDVF